MPNIERAYHILLAAASDAVDLLEHGNVWETRELLRSSKALHPCARGIIGSNSKRISNTTRNFAGKNCEMLSKKSKSGRSAALGKSRGPVA